MTNKQPREMGSVGPLETVAFLCEIAMLVLLAVAGWRLPDHTVFKVLLMIALPVILGVVWSHWMAPTAANRLANPARFVAQSVLFLLTGLLCVWAGMPWAGAIFVVVSIATFGWLAR